MTGAKEADDKFLHPSEWWRWIAFFALGTAVTVVISVVADIKPSDALLLRHPGMAAFVLLDYIFGAIGAYLAVVHFLGKLRA